MIWRYLFVGSVAGLLVLGTGCTSSDTSLGSPTTAEVATSIAEPSGNTAAADPPEVESTETDSTNAESTSSLPAAMRVGANPGVDLGSNWIGRNFMDEGQVDLVWSEVPEAASYQVHRFVVGVDPDTVVLDQSNLIYRGTDLAHSDETVAADTFYVYILVVDLAGEPSSRRWTEALTVTDITPPTPITGLVGERVGSTIELSWNPSSDDVEFASYSVSEVADDGSVTYIGGGTDPSQSSFVDDKPLKGAATYEVVAVDFHDNRTDPVRIEVD